MKPWSCVGMLALLSVVGCGPITYTVNFTNNSPQVTDFVVDERGLDDDSFAPQVAGSGGTATVEHDTNSSMTNIASGTLIGQQLVITDARCSARVTDGDTVEVVKAADGSLTCTVIPGSPQPVTSAATRAVKGLLGR